MRKFKFKFLIFLLLACLICVFTIHTNVIAAANNLELIIAGPGENASTEMLFSWRSTNESATFYYTSNLNDSLSKWDSIDVKGELEDKIFEIEKIANYRFKLELENLTPGTKYAYAIKSGISTSETHYFETAYETGAFNFLWLSDNHAHPGSPDRQTEFEQLYKLAKDNFNSNLPLVLSTGDDTSYGGNYDNWQTLVTKASLFRETVYVSTPGNHTCYDYDSSKIPSEYSNRYFNAIFNTPDNGTDDQSTSFWFIYNSILFISLDSIPANSKASTYLPMQKELLKNAIESNEGKYQYIIVYQHYPFMNALTGNRVGPYGTNYGQWREIFDEYGVDLALSGDHHCYYRSNSLYNDEVVDKNGTVYIGAPQIGGRHREITEENDKEYYASRVTSEELAGNSGATCFTVTSEGIRGTLIDIDGKVHDTYFIEAKRPVAWESEKQGVKDSINVYNLNDKNYICFESDLAKYIDSLEVYNEDTRLLSVSPYITKESNFELKNLNSNKAYNLTVKIKYADDTKEEYKLNCHTYGNIGYLYNLSALINNSKLNISWENKLNNNVIANLKLYADNKLLATLSNNATSYEVELSEINSSTIYKLEALTSNNEVLCTLTSAYSLQGDITFDGKIDENDVKEIFNSIQTNKTFTENEKIYLDLNNDGEIDLGDAFTVNALINKKIDKIVFNTYTVTIIDKNGNKLYEEQINEGEDAMFNINSVDNLLYLTGSINSITKDITIVAVGE